MKPLPIAETFTSIQGEGLFAGTPMFFIRLAGCNVGVYPKRATGDPLPLYSNCESALGVKFQCDTNYHKCLDVSVEELAAAVPSAIQHVCITGGEPFIHPLEKLVLAIFKARPNPYGPAIHIETSGTIAFPPWARSCHVVCSPKRGFLHENAIFVDEWKFVVASREDIDRVARWLEEQMAFDDKPVYLQPVNYTNAVDTGLTREVAKWCLEYPMFRLSAQLHKYLGMR